MPPKQAEPEGPPPQDPEIPKLKAQLAEIQKQLKQDLSSLKADIKESQTTECDNLQSQIDRLPTPERLEAALAALGRTEDEHLEKMHESIQSEIAAAFERMKDQEQQDIGALRQELDKMKNDIEEKENAQVDELMRGIEGSHNLLTTQIQEAMAKAHEEVVAAEQHEKEALNNEISRLDMTIKAASGSLNARCDELKKGIEDLDARLESAKSFMQKADENMASAFEEKISSLERDLSSRTESEMSKTKQSTDALDQKLQPYLDKIAHTHWTVDNMYTRTVTWQIRGFRHKLVKLLEQNERVLTSPPFSVCAQPEMVLDMLAAPEEEPSIPGAIVPPLPTAGSCSIRIWAPPGYQLGFRLTLGEGPSAVTVRRECIFKAGEVLDSAGRASVQLKNLCQLDQIWARKANTVNVTLEVLELKYDDKETQLALAEGEASTDNVEEQAVDLETKLESAVAEIDQVKEDRLFSSRSLTADSIMQERIQSQLQVIKNRSVRRVEWRLEGCSRLLEVLKNGEAVDSPLFSAAGVDKMQLHFYPHGCEVGEKASNHGPPCALYLSGPQRTTLRGIMHVGSNSRQFEQRYQRRGDVGGRGKFCALESQLDMHDSVTIALEILEVESDLPEMSSSLLLREARGPSPISPSYGGNTAHNGGPKGIMRMKRDDPAKTEEVVRCISLPSLNTRQQFLPKVAGGGHKSGIRSR